MHSQKSTFADDLHPDTEAYVELVLCISSALHTLQGCNSMDWPFRAQIAEYPTMNLSKLPDILWWCAIFLRFLGLDNILFETILALGFSYPLQLAHMLVHAEGEVGRKSSERQRGLTRQ
jgi:hypothetical protein